MRVADQIVEYVRLLGVSDIFVLTGNGAMYLNDAVHSNPGVKYVCVHNEAVAASCAAAYAATRSGIGAMSVTAGPGATNAISGLAESWVDSAPVLVVAGQVPSGEFSNYGSSDVHPRSFGIAGFDAATLAKPITLWSGRLESPEAVGEVLRIATVHLLAGRPGPVWIDVPLDVQASPAAAIDLEAVLESAVDEARSRTYPFSPEAFKQLESLVTESRRPMVLVGRGIVDRPGGVETLLSLCKSLKLPYATTRAAAFRCPMDDPMNLGVVGVRGRPGTDDILRRADFILSLGSSLPASITGPNWSYLAPDVKVVQVDADANSLAWSGGRLAMSVHMDAEAFVLDVLANLTLSPSAWADWSELVAGGQQRRNSLGSETSTTPMDIYTVVRTIEEFLTVGDVITSDAGSTYYSIGQACRFLSGAREVSSITFAAMGQALPLAVGSAVALQPSGHLVFCVVGDGSMELNLQELLTVSHYHLPIKILVVNNGGYSSMRAWQDSFFNSRYIGSTTETGAPPLDFKALAFAFHIPYQSVESVAALRKALGESREEIGPQILELVCDPEQELFLPMQQDEV